MKRVDQVRNPASYTGAHCPASGTWVPEADPSASQFIPQGHVFPTHEGAVTAWVRSDEAAVPAL